MLIHGSAYTLRIKIGKEAVILAVKGIAQVSSSPKMNHVQTNKSVSKSTGKSSATKSKSSSSSGEQTKSASSKQTKSSSTKKAMAVSTQTTSKEKKGSSLTNNLGKSVAELAKSIVGKESKKQSDRNQKVSDSNGVKTTVQSGKSNRGETNRSTTKVTTRNATTYVTGAAGIYNGKGQIVSGTGLAGNHVVASSPFIGYNRVIGVGHTSAYTNNRPEESYVTDRRPTTSSTSNNRPAESYKNVKTSLKTSNKRAKVKNGTSNKTGTVKAKNGKVTISYITKPNGTLKRVVAKKPSSLEQTINKYGEKIKYVITDEGIQEFSSFCMGFVPVAGDVLDVVDAATGKDVVTGKKLSVNERGITVLAVLPVVTGPMAKGALKGVKKVVSTKKVKLIVRHADKVDDVKDTGKKVVEKTAKKESAKEGAEKLAKKGGTNSSDEIRDGSHFENGKLKANITYKSGEFDYTYKTDSKGRISNWSTDDLQLTERNERLPHNPKTPGKIEGDHAGHLAGDRFGGSPEIDNLVSQASSVNLSEYKKIENQWAKAIREGKKVTTDVKILYEGDSLRPKGFKVKYTIDGMAYNKRIIN